MVAATFTTNPVSLRYLLTSIRERKLALPDFQRDFVWESALVVDLLASLSRQFPAGSLLSIRCGEETFFEEREFEGAPPLNGNRPEELFLDGQQRLTSLYGALMGGQHHRFFLDVDGLMKGNEFEECVQFLPQTAQQGLNDFAVQAEKLRFPLDRFFRDGGFQSWAAEVAEASAKTMEEAFKLRRDLDEVYATGIRAIEDYSFPVVTLRADTSPEAVCLIFSKINSTGVQLTAFDLLAARWWAAGVRLRTRWKEARDQYPLLARFLGEDGYAVLQVLALKSGQRCTRKPILELKEAAFNEHWNAVIAGFASVLAMLADECGVLRPKYLPFSPALVPLACVWHRVAATKGPQQGVLRERLRRWFWCACFGQRYESSVNSKLVTDAGELDAWLEGGPLPRVVARFDFDPSGLDRVTRPNAARYRAVLALTLSGRPLDFHKRSPISTAQMTEGVDDHHVFPKKSAAVGGADEELVNSILNRALIDATTNKRISNRNPSEYLAEVAQEAGSHEALADVLDSHLLPSQADGPLLADDFAEFLRQRRALIVERVSKATGWKEGARDSADSKARDVGEELRARGLPVDDDTDIDSGYSGVDIGEDDDGEAIVWFGRWDEPRAKYSVNDWLWVQWYYPDEAQRAAWDVLVSAVGADSDYEDDDEERVAPVRLSEANEIAAAIQKFLIDQEGDSSD